MQQDTTRELSLEERAATLIKRVGLEITYSPEFQALLEAELSQTMSQLRQRLVSELSEAVLNGVDTCEIAQKAIDSSSLVDAVQEKADEVLQEVVDML